MEVTDETNISQVPKDVLLQMVLDFDANMITNLCSTSHHFNNIICKNSSFWKKKFLKEYPNIDISNVKEYTKLYSYLGKRPKFVENIGKTKPGDLFVGKIGTSILGKDKVYYNILKGEIFQPEELRKSGLKLPEFPPSYFYNFGVNYFLFPRKLLGMLIQHRVKNPVVEGFFGEKYRVIIEKRPQEVWVGVPNTKNEILANFLDDGQIFIPYEETFLGYF